MSDESIINLSDSTKATMRNYAMVAGFMVLFIYAMAQMLYYFSIDYSLFIGTNHKIFRAIISCSLVLLGSVLAFLHKRDLIAITFLLMGLYNACTLFGPLFGTMSHGWSCPYLIVMVILGIAMLFTRNEQKYFCALILIPGNILRLARYALDLPREVTGIGLVIIALVSLYAVLCIGLENQRLPGYRLLTADESNESEDGSPVHFKISGSILGYSLLMVPAVALILFRLNLLGIKNADLQSIGMICGLMLIFVGFLMLTAGRMKYTPFMFTMLGITMAIQQILGVGWMIAIFLLIIASLCIFRSDKRILVGTSVLIWAINVLLLETAPNGVVIALTTVFLIVLTYVCFALCSDNRLKLI